MNHRTLRFLFLKCRNFFGLTVGALMIWAGMGCSTDPPESALTSEEIEKIKEIIPNASGLALVHVRAIQGFDERPSDGNRGYRVQLEQLAGTGVNRPILEITTEYGGMRPHGDEPDMSRLILHREMFETGTRYWIAFSSLHDYQRFPEGVINVWKHGADATLDMIFRKMVSTDLLRWCPEYEPETGLTFEHLDNPDADDRENHWQIRVRRNESLIWQRRMEGRRSTRYASWMLGSTLPPTEGDQRTRKPLHAETERNFTDGEIEGLPAGTYYEHLVIDLETGTVLEQRISRTTSHDHLIMQREFDPSDGSEVRRTVE